MESAPILWGGYAQDVFRRDNYVCCYCQLDGKVSFDKWLTLCCDHLLSRQHAQRDNIEFIVTACTFCNTVENRFFSKVEMVFDGQTREQLIAQKRPFVIKSRQVYLDYWNAHVQAKSSN
jgi:hypothetical protein